ncbi:hypothetical protein HYALB_00008571 [Hymenoscyphus albidus]|uniref:Uncharacterized protein n=1 Tax=Hymenoscyphus albidus TaxID=595503 RepID=A0A9N9LJH9_9HELO|nr:hypothetical protein HYALB_00008571 [Hymenoscyphus albidus]
MIGENNPGTGKPYVQMKDRNAAILEPAEAPEKEPLYPLAHPETPVDKSSKLISECSATGATTKKKGFGVARAVPELSQAFSAITSGK